MKVGMEELKGIKREIVHLGKASILYLLSDSYMDFYSRKKELLQTGWRGRVGPADEGGFEMMAKWQFERLKDDGLSPSHTMLDIGCGVLRGGLYFIDYLNKGNYVGIDMDVKALEKARERIVKHSLQHKQPTIFKNDNLRFCDQQFSKYDYILAQSVFTHLPPYKIKECMGNIDNVLDDDGAFLATFTRRYRYQHNALSWGFKYPFSFFQDLCSSNGLKVELIFSGQPNGQELMKIWRV